MAGPSLPMSSKKRKLDSNSADEHAKRLQVTTAAGETGSVKVTAAPQRRIKKLVPPRPYPTVPSSVSATGPRSAHTEGKNYICITRKTSLGRYLRRCKDAIMKDGYKTLHLNAMGAAIPHLALLTVALPGILPFGAGEVRTEVRTGTVEVQDEVVPEDEEEDISYQTRGKSTLCVVIEIGAQRVVYEEAEQMDCD